MSRTQLEVDGVSHRTVPLGDLEVHVAEAGSGPPLLLQHGWPQHWYAWRKLVPLLRDRYRLIMPDMRGFGWTDAPRRGYAKEQLATDLLHLLDALGLDRVDLVGHDWGGWVGFLACLRAPHRFGRYLALSVTHPWMRLGLRGLLDVARFSYQVPLSTPHLGRALLRRTDFTRTLIRLAAAQPMEEDALDAYAASIREPERAAASVRLYRQFLLAEALPIMGGRYRDRRLTVPTRVLLGAHDPAIRPHLLAGHAPYAETLEVAVHAQAGHFPAEEQPEWVADHIIEWCR